MQRANFDGGINLSKLPPIDKKPVLRHGYISDIAKYPVIKNFSHVLRWMYANFSTTNDISKLMFSNSIKRVGPYLFEVTCDRYDWSTAKKYLDEEYKPEPAGCSTIWTPNRFAHNFDWYYDSTATFIIRTPETPTRHASVSVAGGMSALTDEVVSTGEYNKQYDILPFLVSDGINDAGVAAAVNIVQKKDGTAELWTGTEICAFAAVRYVLDNCATAVIAAQDLKDKVYMPKGVDCEFQFMVADKNGAYVVCDGQITQVTNSRPFITNFRSTGDILNQDGKVDFEKVAQIDPHGSGLERYNQIIDGYSSINSLASMKSVMTGLNFSNAYDLGRSTFWKTEYCGNWNRQGDIIVTTPLEDYLDDVVDKCVTLYEQHNRKRPSGRMIWPLQTTHTSIYDYNSCSLCICVQENGKFRTFNLDPYETVSTSSGSGGGGGQVPSAITQMITNVSEVVPAAARPDVPTSQLSAVTLESVYNEVEDIRRCFTGS